jgi:prepilin-type N-terminal cleavage/methylation domain-containing protein
MFGKSGSIMLQNTPKRGFSLLEVIVASTVAVLVLVALLSLEIKSTALAARAAIGFDTLPVAIDFIEELSNREVTGESQEMKGEYEIKTKADEIDVGIPISRIQVEVLYHGETYSALSIYKFNF